MHGSLSFERGILYVGRYATTAHIRPYDLDGRALGPGFTFRGRNGGRAAVKALAVDSDHRLWVADDAASGVRCFTQFGREVSGIESKEPADADAPGHIGRLNDVVVSGEDVEQRVLVACGGYRRHALHQYSGTGELIASLRPHGDPLGEFRGLTSIAVAGRMAYACEAATGYLHVYRDAEFHCVHRTADWLVPRGSVLRALAVLSNGWIVIAHGDDELGGVLLANGSGRLIRNLAGHGVDTGEVFGPIDVAIHEANRERDTLIAAMDRDGERVQLFTLDGRCLGALVDLPGGPIHRRPCRQVPNHEG